VLDGRLPPVRRSRRSSRYALHRELEVEHSCSACTSGGRENGTLHARREVTRRVDARYGGLESHGIDSNEAVAVERDAERLDDLDLSLRRMCKEGPTRHPVTVGQLDLLEMTPIRDEARHPSGLESDPGRLQLLMHLFRDFEGAVGEDDDIARSSSSQQRERDEVRSTRGIGEVPPRTVLHLPAVAIGTLKLRSPTARETRRSTAARRSSRYAAGCAEPRPFQKRGRVEMRRGCPRPTRPEGRWLARSGSCRAARGRPAETRPAVSRHE
jgi:hypothetical protein